MNKRYLIIILVIGGVLGVLIFSTILWPIINEGSDAEDPEANTYEINIRTYDATKISTLFATLNGELIDMGDYSSVEVYFVWGDTPGEFTKETQKKTMTSPGNFSIEISDDFEPGNNYYFQARSIPEGRGSEFTFYVY